MILVLPIAVWAMWRLGFFRGLGMAVLLIGALLIANMVLDSPKGPSTTRGVLMALATAPPIIGLHLGFFWGTGAAALAACLVAFINLWTAEEKADPVAWPTSAGIATTGVWLFALVTGILTAPASLKPMSTEVTQAEAAAIGPLKDGSLSEPASPAAVTTASVPKDPAPLTFQIAAREDISFRGTQRMVYRVVFDSASPADSVLMRATAEHIWRTGNQQWSEFTVFGYLPGLPTDGAAYAVAEFRPSGLASFQVQRYVLTGTKYEPPRPPEPSPKLSRTPRTYRYDLTVRETSPRTVSIDLATDLPDGTMILVDVSRSFWESDSPDEFSGDIYSQDHPVRNGHVRVTVPVRDRQWHSERVNLNARLAAAGAGVSRITRISPRVEVSALYSPYRDQPSNVRAELGPNAEYVRGPGVQRVGSARTLRVAKTLAIPFER